MGWNQRRRYADPEAARERLLASQSVAQAATALSQLVEARNIRMMGSQAGERSQEYINRTEIDRAIVGMTESFVATYFMPIFVEYWDLRTRWLKELEYRIVAELDTNINLFRGTYNLYRVIHELAMTGFDMKFDQHHTIATMLDIDYGDEDEKDQPRQGPTYLATDASKLETQIRATFAARDRAKASGRRARIKAELPTFDDALEMAKTAIKTPEEKKRKRRSKPKDEPVEEPEPEEDEEELEVEFYEPEDEEEDE